MALIGALLTVGVTTPAAAAGNADCPYDPNRKTRVCEVRAIPTPDRGAAKPAKDSSGVKTVTCAAQFPGAIDCDPPVKGAWWSTSRGCWVSLEVPQPGKDEAVWLGHTDGAIYRCTYPGFVPIGDVGGDGTPMPTLFWTDTAPAQVNPAAMAREAVERMELVAPTVGAIPLNDGPGVVGLQTWLWVANDGPTSMGPISRTATAGAESVTATARVTGVTWDMGNGDVKRCSNAGTEWRRGMPGSKEDSPTCGYTYLRDSGDQPGDAYTITPTTHWQVDWEGAGQSGQITFSLDGPSTAMTVVELQTLRVGS